MRQTLKSGFTLVEMLITMGIVSVLFVVFAQLAGGIFALQLQSGNYASLTQDYRYLLTRLSYDVGRANSLIVTDSSTLDLTISATNYRYHWDGTNLTLTVGGAELLNSPATSLSAFSLTSNTELGGHPSVTVATTLTTTYSLPNQSSLSLPFNTTLGIRQ